MLIKIVSDGTTHGTQVVNQETGERIGLIQSVEWKAEADQPWTECTIKIAKVPLELVTDQVTIEDDGIKLRIGPDKSLVLQAKSITMISEPQDETQKTER